MRFLLKLLEIAVAILVPHPTGVCNEVVSAYVVAFVASIVSAPGKPQVVRYGPGDCGQNAGFDMAALFRRYVKVTRVLLSVVRELGFASSAIRRDDGDPTRGSIANRADNGVPGLMVGGSFLFGQVFREHWDPIRCDQSLPHRFVRRPQGYLGYPHNPRPMPPFLLVFDALRSGRLSNLAPNTLGWQDLGGGLHGNGAGFSRFRSHLAMMLAGDEHVGPRLVAHERGAPVMCQFTRPNGRRDAQAATWGRSWREAR
jgi:hypothetical protein